MILISSSPITHDTGTWNSSILDILCKHGIAFIYDDGHNMEGIQPQFEGADPDSGDLIAISDGYHIVTIGKALIKSMPVKELPGGYLSKSDQMKIDHAYD
jgi:hypothetical protein